MFHRFERSLESAWPPASWREVTVMLAVSGGADSVALVRSMHSLAEGETGRLVLAHFNHRLRGADSDADVEFIRALADELKLRLELAAAERVEQGNHHGQGPEAAARKQRYEFLSNAARRCGARYLATAHTSDDQAETILHRILRGTGPAGLGGIPRTRLLSPALTLIRPMLGIPRAEVIEYLDEIGQPFRSDASNLDSSFTRNRIRHELLPQLVEQYNPQVVDALLRLGQLAGEAQETIDTSVSELMSGAVATSDRDDDSLQVDCRRLAEQPPYLVSEMFATLWRERGWPMQAMGFDEWRQLAELAAVCRDGRKRMFPGGIVALRRGNHLWLTRKRK